MRSEDANTGGRPIHVRSQAIKAGVTLRCLEAELVWRGGLDLLGVFKHKSISASMIVANAARDTSPIYYTVTKCKHRVDPPPIPVSLSQNEVISITHIPTGKFRFP